MGISSLSRKVKAKKLDHIISKGSVDREIMSKDRTLRNFSDWRLGVRHRQQRREMK